MLNKQSNQIEIRNFTFKINPSIMPILYFTNDLSKNHFRYSEIALNLPIKYCSKNEMENFEASSYEYLSPKMRYAYLEWLGTDLSSLPTLEFAYVLFKSIDRRIYENSNVVLCINLISKLFNLVDKYTFGYYCSGAVGFVINELHKSEFVLDTILNKCNPKLIVYSRKYLSAKNMVAIASAVGFKNKRYINNYPDLFEESLSKVLIEYNGIPNFSYNLTPKQIRKLPIITLKSYYCSTKIPNILSLIALRNDIKNELQLAHKKIKPVIKIIRAT